MEFYDRSDVLCHHGIKGMKWGVRRTEAQLGRARGKKKKTTARKKPEAKEREPEKKRLSEMTDDELNNAIRRLDLERRYSDMVNPKPVQKQKLFDGKKFVVDIIETKGKQLAGELAYYYAGTAINKLTGANIANVKSTDNSKKNYNNQLKIAKNMSYDDLDAAVKRLNLEKRFADLATGGKPDDKKDKKDD